MKFAANISFMFQEVPYLQRFQAAKNAGFKAVESGFPFMVDAEEVIEAKKKSGISQILLNLYTGDVSKRELGCTAIPGKEQEFKDRLERTINLAKRLECSKIHVMAGIQDSEGKFTRGQQMKCYTNNLNYAAQRLQTEGILGVIEPINQHSVPGYFLNNYEDAVKVIEEINSPNLKLLFDVFHCQRIRGDIIPALNNWSSHIGHVQIAQSPDRGEPSSPGEIDYCDILKKIESEDYNEWVGLEYNPTKATADTLDWVKSYGYIL